MATVGFKGLMPDLQQSTVNKTKRIELLISGRTERSV